MKLFFYMCRFAIIVIAMLIFFKFKMYMSFILTLFILMFMIYLIILRFVNIRYVPFWLCNKEMCSSKLLSMHYRNNGELKVFMEDIKNFKLYTTVTFFNIISFVISFLIYLVISLPKNIGENSNLDIIASGYLVFVISIFVYSNTKQSLKNFRIEYYEKFDDECNIRVEPVKGEDLTPTNPNKSVNGNMIDD